MLQLDEIEARVLGSLIEKSLTTPEYYPLSLNALLLACNQKTSRDPVMNLDETALGKALYVLLNKGVIERHHEPGSRVPKFKHHAEILLTLASPKEIAVLCVLLLRGPQTSGEIKTRTDRLFEFTSPAEVESVLHDLAARTDGPFVTRLKRMPGQKEARYQHLFFGPVAGTDAGGADEAPAAPAVDRVALLEARIATLEAQVKKLEERLSQPA